MTDQEAIVIPLGKKAGKLASVRDAIDELNLELNYLSDALAHESALINTSLPGLSPEEKARGEMLKAEKDNQACNLRRFGLAAWLIWCQMLTPEERAKEDAKVSPEKKAEWRAMLQGHGLILPDWFLQLPEDPTP